MFIFYLLTIVLGAAPNVSFGKLGDSTNDVVNASMKVNVLTGNLTGYYYATEAFFKEGDVGYLGVQPRAGQELQHLTFSAFGEGPFSTHPNCRNGADGGSGVSCSAQYPWKFNHNYTFEFARIHHDNDTGNNTWRGTFIDDETNSRFIVAEYVTPVNYGVLSRGFVSFDEYYAANGHSDNPETYPCYPKSSYIQYAPTIITESGDFYETRFEHYGGGYDKLQDKCAYAANKTNYRLTTLNPYAVKFENGILSP